MEYTGAAFDDVSGLFNVVVVRMVPRPGGAERVAAAVAIDTAWSMGAKCVAGILSGIGHPDKTPWEGGSIVDAYLEPCPIPRPWTAETLGAFRRDTFARQREEETEALRRENAQLMAQLSRSVSPRFAAQVAAGEYDMPAVFP